MDDYPAVAMRNREEGMVGFRLDVGANGRVSNCTITQSSASASLDNATCRLLTARARFTPARDLAGNPVSDALRGRVAWRIVNDFDRPWAPALFVEEMRSTAAGAVTCAQGWPPEESLDEACPAGEAVELAARARAAGKPLTRSIVTKLTPEGMTEAADRPGRGDPYWAADATFTIGAEGKLLECTVTRNAYLGRDRRRGVPPNPCADWDVGTNRLYVPAADGAAERRVRVTVRGFIGASVTPAP
jgi:TonB family protein